MSRRRVAILSPGGPFVDALLARLGERGLEVDALVLYRPGGAGEWRKAAARGMRLRALALTPVRWARRWRRQRGHARAARARVPVVLTGRLNGARMERDVRRLAPDVLVLAHCGLVAPPLLRIPADGVVNVHPGLLPWIRGNSPLANSLLRGVPLGATAFRVDPGIDTGAILARRLVPLRGGETLAETRDALFLLWVEMTADLVADAREGAIPSGAAQPDRFPLCHTLAGPAALEALEEAVRRGDAKTLLDRWAPACDAPDLSLPADFDAARVGRVPR